MRLFKILRLAVAILIVVATFFLLVLPKGINKGIKIITPTATSMLRMSGDLNDTITIHDKWIDINQRLSLKKRTMDSALYKYFEDKAVNRLHTRAFSERDQAAFRNNASGYKDLYLAQFLGDGWKYGDTSVDQYVFLKKNRIGLEMGPLIRTKVIAIPLGTVHIDQRDTAFKPNNRLTDTVRFQRNFWFTYNFSANSNVILFAKNGLILNTYPHVDGEDMLDSSDTELFHFRTGSLNQEVSEHWNMLSINLKLLNPLYHNVIGDMVAGWSISKIIGWAFVSLIALFADKVKDKILKPIADRIFKNVEVNFITVKTTKSNTPVKQKPKRKKLKD